MEKPWVTLLIESFGQRLKKALEDPVSNLPESRVTESGISNFNHS